jgi:hypothetical protein
MAVLFPMMARSGIRVSPAQQVGNQVTGTIALRRFSIDLTICHGVGFMPRMLSQGVVTGLGQQT